jgi:hypothetical protein
MRLQELFGLIVRLVGLSFAAYGLFELIGSISDFGRGLYAVAHGPYLLSNWLAEIVSVQLPAVLYIATGWLVLMKSERIVRLTYHTRTARGLCPECGYDIRASADRCPECGTAIQQNCPMPTK